MNQFNFFVFKWERYFHMIDINCKKKKQIKNPSYFWNYMNKISLHSFIGLIFEISRAFDAGFGGAARKCS